MDYDTFMAWLSRVVRDHLFTTIALFYLAPMTVLALVYSALYSNVWTKRFSRLNRRFLYIPLLAWAALTTSVLGTMLATWEHPVHVYVRVFDEDDRIQVMKAWFAYSNDSLRPADPEAAAALDRCRKYVFNLENH